MVERRALAVSLAVAVGCLAEGALGQQQQAPPKIAWTRGPAEAKLGAVAQIKLPVDTAFAGPDDARKILEAMGNFPDGQELGLVIPAIEGQQWFIIYRHHPVGYIRDTDSDKIDAAAIFDGIREGTERSNAERKKKGVPGLHLVKWQEAPHYDPKTHHLLWALLARDDEGGEVVNYNVRMLGRDGYVSATLVESAARFEAAKPGLAKVMEGFSFAPGKTYAEWRPGDKVAEYGVTALVAAGAGAAAAKFGLFAFLAKFFAKAGKLIIVALVAVGAGVAKLVASLFGGPRGGPSTSA